jgi:hypothetical protein
VLTTQPDLFEPPQFVPFHGFDRTHTVVDIDYSATTIGAGHTPGRIRQDFLFGGPYSASQYNEIAEGPLYIIGAAVAVPALLGGVAGAYAANPALVNAATLEVLGVFTEFHGLYRATVPLEPTIRSAYIVYLSAVPGPFRLPATLVVPPVP